MTLRDSSGFVASSPPDLGDWKVPSIQDRIEVIWNAQGPRYNKANLVDSVIERLKREHPSEWAAFVAQSERDLVRSVISGLEFRSRRHDRAAIHAEVAAARAASLEAEGHVGDARYAVKGGVFAWVRALTLDEVRDQASHCRKVAEGAATQADRWDSIAAKMVSRGATFVGDAYTDEELDALWSETD